MNKDLKEKFAFTLAEGATHVGIFHNTRRVGFTLAEVLITLGIIGIVSAMTIPTLIKNYQEKVRDNQFKKAYATLNQALRLTTSEFGYQPKCYAFSPSDNDSDNKVISECKIFYETLVKNLKVVKHCPNKAFEGGCIPHYDGFEVILKEQHKNDEDYDEEYWDKKVNNTKWWRTEHLKNTVPAYVLSDGSILIPYGNGTSFNAIFLLDINGFSGPNKFNHDVFEFILYLDNSRYIILGGASMGVIKGGIMTQNLIEKLFGTYEIYY